MSENRTYFYARVSSRDQNLARQLEAFRDAWLAGELTATAAMKQLGVSRSAPFTS